MSFDLQTAARVGDVGATKNLLDNYADYTGRKGGIPPLLVAAENGHHIIVRLLLEKEGIEINTANFDGDTPLHLAAIKGHAAVVELLLGEEGVDANLGSPLLWAVKGRHEEIVRLLLGSETVHVDSTDSEGRTPLSWAVQDASEGIVDVLLGKGAHIDSEDRYGWTPLAYAARSVERSMVELLVQRGACLDAKDEQGRTPFSWAAGNGVYVMVEWLLQRGACLDAEDKQGRTPLSWAAGDGGDEEVLELLLQNECVDVNSKDSNGRTPLSWAAGKDREIAVKLLLRKEGIDINAKDHRGRTPLSWAVEEGYRYRALIPLLEVEGIDLNAKDNDGLTPLMWALQSDRLRSAHAIQLLLETEGMDCCCRDNKGRIPLFLAAAHFDPRVLALMLKKPCFDPQTKDQDGKSWLSHAAAAGQHRLVEGLLQHGFDPNGRDNNGRTPLSWAAGEGHEESVQAMLKIKDIDPESKDNENRTPLSWALKNEHQAVAALLSGRDHVTLHMLVQEGDQAAVESLLRTKCHVDVRDSLHRTPLLVATSYGRLEIAKKLILWGANVDNEDSDGMTALRIAVRRRDIPTMNLLLGKCARTGGITAAEWFEANQDVSRTVAVRITERSNGEKSVDFLEGTREGLPETSDKSGSERKLVLFTDYDSWQSCLPDQLRDILMKAGTGIVPQEHVNPSSVSFFLAASVPPRWAGQGYFDTANWTRCGIAWTIAQPASLKGRGRWRSMEHWSMLPYGCIPDSGLEFFLQYILNPKERWTGLCVMADEYLAKRRLDQLHKKGRSTELINHLAEDAQNWTELRSTLRSQVRTATEFASGYCQRYNEDVGFKKAKETLDDFSETIDLRISQLEQVVRDLLQLEFAWVSINEAHRSTSLATSMKRLSWITFIFLPLMFVSSLFGMNVNLLKNNPDWRWFILFGTSISTATLLAWLIFKYSPLEGWIERKADNVRQRLNRNEKRKKLAV